MKYGLIFKVLLLSTMTGCASLKSLTDIDISKIDDIGSTIEAVKNGQGIPGGSDVDWTKVAKAGTDAAKALTLSDEDVRKASMQFSQYTDENNTIAPPSSEYARRLARLTKNMKEEDGLQLNYKAYLTPEVNAFAYADGSIRVFSGLMDMLDDQELLAIIGHEIGHVKAGHSASRMRLALATSGLREGVGAISGTAEVLADSSVVGGLVEKFINAQFSQANEDEADSYGAAFLARHGYDPNAAVAALQKIAKLEEDAGEDANEIRFLSTHPAPGRRAVRLASEIREKGLSATAMAQLDKPAAQTAIVTDNDWADLAQQDNQPKEELAKVVDNHLDTLQSANSFKPVKTTQFAGDYYIQISAFQSAARAEERVATLSSAGVKATTQNALVKGVPYVRVLVGPFLDRSSASAESLQLQELGLLEETPFIRRDL